MENRRTDNLPVTDASLARVRDEIAGAFSHPSPDTITLDTDQSAMLHRTIQNLTQREADLRSQLDEAVVLLRRLHGTVTCAYPGNGVSIVNTSAAHGTSDSPQRVIYLDARSFLSRLDGGEVTR